MSRRTRRKPSLRGGRWAEHAPRGVIPRDLKRQLMSGCVVPDSPKSESTALAMKTGTGTS